MRTGSSNTAIGFRALQSNISGSNNTALGKDAGTRVSTASGVVAIGTAGANEDHRTFVANLTNAQTQDADNTTVKVVTVRLVDGRLGVGEPAPPSVVSSQQKVEEQQASIAELQKKIEVLTAQLKEQAAQIQKVSAQLEASKPAPQVVNNP